MVLVKRSLESGNNGYRSPPIVNVPRGRRSIRKRPFRQKSGDGGQICAFELLATVAGKLLEESECSSASSSAAGGFEHCEVGNDVTKGVQQDAEKPAGGELHDQGSSENSVYFLGTEKGICKEKLGIVNEMTGEHASPFGSSVSSEKVDSNSKIANQKDSKESVKVADKVLGDFDVGRKSDFTDVENGVTRKLDLIGDHSGDITNTLANKSLVPKNSVDNAGLPPDRNSIPSGPFLKHGNNVKLRSKDNDEILSRCSQPNMRKIFRSPTYVGDRRIRKLLSSKYWKSAPKLKDYDHSNSGGVAKHTYQTKRPIYELDRSQRDYPLKKRRIFERSSVVTYDRGISCESVSNSPEMNRDNETNAPSGKYREGIGMSSPGFRRQNSCNSRNSQVRLSIKSFKVPELFVEVPESTTIGSLKRTVLEAVTSILGGGIRVGVLLHGKKVRDDNRTLLQTGISQNDDINTLGFMLEPNSPTQPSPPIRAEESPAPLLVDSPKFVNRPKINPKEDMYLLDSLDKPSVTDSNCPARSIRDLLPSTATDLTDKVHSDSKALVPVPEANLDALAVVSVNQRPKRSEIGQRRTRRPFSVSEVEALVSAVEKLGTGRWRDVKLCAFENAKHRTYVDLKDKWKTLVHTARISPQQRRGEPVPQELLDRVLAAQAYWSEHQAKQHGKQLQQGTFPKLTDSLTGKA